MSLKFMEQMPLKPELMTCQSRRNLEETMYARLLPRPLRYTLAAIVLALIVLALVGQSLTTVQAARLS
jgi:hypothetical protein